ncbi:MAG: PD-(D/E)XK nuclease domain-containing protein [Deltaproteobacteria bacterium]|nr:PD-(D/E)XK nuclease domain-containing protein [Deltaproteobacteria bacterium]
MQDSQNLHLSSEKAYHAILHASLLSAGFHVISEASGGEGRSDITLFLNDGVCIVIELKYVPSTRTPNIALKKNDGKDRAEKKRSEKAKEKRRVKELSAALDSAEKQVRDKDYAGPYRATQHKVICMAMAIRHRTEVAVRFFDC